MLLGHVHSLYATNCYGQGTPWDFQVLVSQNEELDWAHTDSERNKDVC